MNNSKDAQSSTADFIAILKSRRTIHVYTDQVVPSVFVDEAVSAAHYAPNHRLTWPWRFTAVGPNVKSKINALALKMKSANGPLAESQLELFKKKRIHPQLMVVSQVIADDPFQSKEDYAAVSCAIQNFSLALAAHGVGTKWSTGSMTRHSLAYELTGIDPNIEEIVGFLWYGYPARTPSPKRPELSSIYRTTP